MRSFQDSNPYGEMVALAIFTSAAFIGFTIGLIIKLLHMQSERKKYEVADLEVFSLRTWMEENSTSEAVVREKRMRRAIDRLVAVGNQDVCECGNIFKDDPDAKFCCKCGAARM